MCLRKKRNSISPFSSLNEMRHPYKCEGKMGRKSPLQHLIKVIVYLFKRINYLDHSSYIVFLHFPSPNDLVHLFYPQQNLCMQLEINKSA